MDERRNARRSVRPNGRPNRASRPNRGRRPANNRDRQRMNTRQSSRLRRRKRNRTIAILLVLCAVIIGIGGTLFWIKFGPSKEMADLNEYYGISGNDDLAIIADNQVLGAGGRLG